MFRPGLLHPQAAGWGASPHFQFFLGRAEPRPV